MHTNETVVRAALAAIAAGDADAFALVVADDLVAHVPGRSPLAGDHHGRGALGRRIHELSGGKMSIEIHDVLASPDHAVGLYTMRLVCPDRSVEWRHANIYRIRDAKIVEVWQNPFEQDRFDDFFNAC